MKKKIIGDLNSEFYFLELPDPARDYCILEQEGKTFGDTCLGILFYLAPFLNARLFQAGLHTVFEDEYRPITT